MAAELDDPEMWRRVCSALPRLGLALLIGVPFAALGFFLSVRVVHLFIVGWEAFAWAEVMVAAFFSVGVLLGWKWTRRLVKRRTPDQTSP